MGELTLITKYLEIVAAKPNLPAIVTRAVGQAANDLIRHSGKFYRLHHDFETYCDVSVVDVGSDFYARHPSCEALMCAYAVNDEDILQWVPAEGEEMPRDLAEMLKDPHCVKFAWNKPFEWAIWSHVLKMYIPHTQWRDPMVMAYSLSLPGKLEKAGEVVGLPDDQKKMKRGAALIRKFCGPVKPTRAHPSNRWLPAEAPEDWEEFKLYNRTDVSAERGIYKRLVKYDMPRHEWALWVVDQEINQAGIPINMDMVNNAIEIYEDLVGEALDEMKLLTGLANPGSQQQILKWLKQRGYPFDDCTKGHIKRGEDRAIHQIRAEGITQEEEDAILETIIETLKAGMPYEYQWDVEGVIVIRRVLHLRQRAAKASPKKYYALVAGCDQSNPEGAVLRNAFQFAGAGRTWRWSGRMFQAQNLPRPATKHLEKNILLAADHVQHLSAPAIRLIWEEPFDVLTSCIRPAAQAPPGFVFVDVDLNAIENRMLGWQSGCAKILKVFEEDRDPYIDFSTRLFGGTYEQRWNEYDVLKDSTKRTISKPGVLGCGYMLGEGEIRTNKDGEEEATGLLGYAWQMGIREFTQEQSSLSVQTFRREFLEVVDFWYAIERAAKRCLRTGKPVTIRMLEFDMKGPFLRMNLPSGRSLHYFNPMIERVKAPWGEFKDSITYEGTNEKKQWMRQSTHPGKLTENADQAMSRDVIARGMMIAKREYNIDIRIHVHDQIVALAKEDKAEETLRQLKEAMTRDIDWAPGLPLGCAGHISQLFIKD